MGRSYSLDLCERVLAFVGSGHSRRAAARHFGGSTSFAVKLLQRVERRGSARPARQGRPPGRGKLVPFEPFLIGTVEPQPDMTMPERAELLRASCCGHAMGSGQRRPCCRALWASVALPIKQALLASETARADGAASRQTWMASRQPRMRQQPGRLVFIDETSVTTRMTRLRGRSRKGQRAQGQGALR
jgi:hypothetical protein